MTRDEFLDAVYYIAESVYDFHERWEFGSHSKNVIKLKDLFQKERDAILDEEIQEFKEEVDAERWDKGAHELADVLFVVLGHCEAYPEIAYALREVADKNNNKTEKTHAIRSDTGKLIALNRPDKWVGAEDEHYYHLKKAMEI